MARPGPLYAATILLVAVVAGCAGDTPRVDLARLELDIAADAAPSLRLEHDDDDGHRDGTLHQGRRNVELVGYSNGVDDSGDPNRIPAGGAYNEVAVRDGFAYVSAISADGSFGGFSIIDIADPAQPRFVSHWAGPPGSDVEVSSNGTLVYFATQRNSPQQVVGGAAATQDPLAHLPRGIHVVDVSDKASPREVAFTPLPPNGPHTITPYLHDDGNEYLLACTYDLVTDPGTGAILSAVPITQRLVVFRVTDNDALPLPVPLPVGDVLGPVSLVPVAQFQLTGAAPSGELWFPHDATVQAHPFDGRILVTLAYWDEGVRILDFTHPPGSGGPVQPPSLPGLEDVLDQLPMLEEVGALTDFSPSALDAIHLAKPFQVPVAGRHVTVAEPEVVNAAAETGQITFIDTTDPANPERLGWWALGELVSDLGVRNLDFSPHNFATFDPTIDGRERHLVALAHYHAGVWIIDASDEALLREPRAVGYYMPRAPDGKVRDPSPVYSPMAWSVAAHEGLLYATDEATGLHILRYTGP